MAVGVLGPVHVDDTVTAFGPRDRMALGVLVVRRQHVVAPDQFADALWGERPPASWQKQVQICIARLRKVLGVDAIETTDGGYRLHIDDDDLDVCRFELLAVRGRELMAVGEYDRAAATHRRALSLWRGPPLRELDGWMPAQSEAARLDELRRTVEEDWLAARLEAGEQREVAADAEILVNEEPLRERRWAILALAQYRCARQVDALRSLARARRTLGEIGIEPGAELVALEGAILRQDPSLSSVPEAPAASETCPYMGLAPYDERDTEGFFGRDSEIQACIGRLQTTPLLVVAGPSGCGKSSLVRAGVVPALRRRGVDVVIVTPGSDPAGALTEAAGAGEQCVWVVDQFEELFTLGASHDVVRNFCRTIVEHTRGGDRVILVVRSDQLGGISVDAELTELAESGLHLVSTLSGPALREAIEEPARQAGLRLEHGLVDLLVRDCEGEPGALPLLSHALAETWRRRDGHTLTVDGYEGSGGIRVAVARSADRLYDSLPAEERETLRSILLRLVTPTLDGDPVRCRVSSRSILGEPGRDRVVGLLVRARLVTSEKETFEIAHEALARAWPRLRSWLDDDVAGQRIMRHLVSAADGWDSLGRPDTELYRGARLETALEWREHASTDLTDLESTFLDASVELAESEQRALVERAERESRANRRLRGLLVGLGVVVVGSLVAGALAVRASRQADRASQIAAARELSAAADASIEIDPERGLLLALAAVERAGPVGGAVLDQAEEALHRAMAATQIEWRVTDTGGAVDRSADGVHVVTEGPEGSGRVDIRDAETGEAALSIDAHDGDVTDVAYNDDGSLLGTTGFDGTARIWDPVTGEELQRVTGVRGSAVWSPAFTSDGALFAAAWPDVDDGLVRVADVSTGAIVLESRSVPGAEAVSWAPDGARLAVASAYRPEAAVIDATSGAELFELIGDGSPITDIEWSPDGASIAAATGAAAVRVFDAASGELRFVLHGHGATVGGVSWSPDSLRLATAGADGTVKVWAVIGGSGLLLTTLTAGDMRSGFDDAVFSPDGMRLITGSRTGVTAAWDVSLAAGSEVATLPAAAYFYSTAQFDRTGDHLYATGGGGRVGVWDTDTWKLVRVLGGTGPSPSPTSIPGVVFGSLHDVMRIAPSPDGQLVASVTDASTIGQEPGGRVRVHDTGSGDEVFDLLLGTWTKDADWSPDGDVVAVAGGDDNATKVWFVDRAGTIVDELRFGPDEGVGVARFTRDGESVVVEIEPRAGRYEPGVGRVEVWDWRSGELVRAIPADAWWAVPSPVDDIVATAPHERAGDQEAAVWDLRTGERIATLAGQTGGVNQMTFSPDGTRLAVASGDGTTRVWDPMTGDLQLTLAGHLGSISAVSFSPDGSQLATAAVDGRVRIWALDLDTLVELAEQRVARTLTDEECRRFLDQEACPVL